MEMRRKVLRREEFHFRKERRMGRWREEKGGDCDRNVKAIQKTFESKDHYTRYAT